jgi:uncharacterized protein YutE (UPF0331/DUF86 family)
MVDEETIRRRAALLRDVLADLRRYRDRYDLAAITGDRDVQHMVLHALYVAAQAAVDLALHAAADAEQPGVGTYQQAFDRLVAAGLLDVQLAGRMKGWAGLRNVLAHHYATIDYTRIAFTLANELPDLERFAAVVDRWV